MRSRSQILRASAIAGLLSGVPSTVWTLARTRSARAAGDAGVQATRAVGTLIAPGRPGLVRGALVHGVISLAVTSGLAAALPRGRGRAATAALGGGGGLAFGVVALGVVAPRRYPAVAALGLGPQLADNAAFGLVARWVLAR